jgi:GNAT superfamily N-acetyltransferase
MLQLRRATEHDLDTIIGLIDKAAEWLGTKGIDQWATPWPNRAARDERVSAGIEADQTWVLEADDGTVAATVSMDHEGNAKLWKESELAAPAVYVQRLVIDRRYAGMGLGAQLIDWAGRRAREEYGAKWIRIDVWTHNYALHRYYESVGFIFRRRRSEPDYPAGTLLEKATQDIAIPAKPLFKESADSLRSFSARWDFAANPLIGVLSDLGTRVRNTARCLPGHRLTGPVAVVFIGCAQFASLLLLGPWAGASADQATPNGFTWASAINMVSLLVLAVALVIIGPRDLQGSRRRSRLSEVVLGAGGDRRADGFLAALRDRRIQLLLIMMATVTVATDPTLAFGPALAKQMGGSEVWAGFFIVVLSAGPILGSFLPEVRPNWTPSLRASARVIGALGIAMAIFSFAPQTWLSVTAALVAGVMTLVAGATTQSLVLAGEGTRNARRVMAAWSLALVGGRPIASLIDGLVAGMGGGIRMTCVILELPAVVVGALAVPALARLGRSYLTYRRPLINER